MICPTIMIDDDVIWLEHKYNIEDTTQLSDAFIASFYRIQAEA